VDESIGRLALTSVSALAHREDLTIGPGGSLLSATTSASALGHLLQGQKHFWSGDLERAAAELQAAIKADSGCGLAYLRLSLVQAWQFDYGGAVGSVDAGLGLRERMAPRWVNLLEAQRHLMLGSGREAIDGFQNAVLDHRDDIDAWFGLGESLFHYGSWNGQSPQDSRPALERVAQLDSTFAPIYDHLVDLALLEGDSIRAALYLDRMPADPSKEVRRVAMVLRFGPDSARHVALKQLRAIDRQALSQLVPIYLHDGLDPALADTIAMSLLGPDRTPDDRRRGAAFRLVSLAAQHRWPEAVASWKSAAGAPVFDSWIIQAQLAGFPAADLAKPMYAWADSLLRAGRLPDFTLPFWEDAQQGFHAIVHRAALAGDSAGVADLLRRIDTAPPNADPSDPTKDTFRAALEARLALLAADTTKAIERLRLSVSRVQEPWTWYYPLTAMAPERLLLSALLDARGATDESARWRRSFTHSWSVGDVLFATTLQARATAPADASAR
jgi:tetratricopeptide (TPR) repeat protein